MNKPAANMVWDQRVAGSNPATPTNKINDLAKPQDGDCTDCRTTTTVPRALRAEVNRLIRMNDEAMDDDGEIAGHRG
jgi:hypothetical protein